MISNHSRSYWFGGSDYAKVMTSNHKTISWCRWWEEKIGGEHVEFSNIYMQAGTMYEHPILEAIGLKPENMDRTIYLPEYRLRINLDGDKDGWIYEVKTHKPEKDFYLSEAIKGQCQLQMFAYQNCKEELPEFKGLKIVSYPILDYEEVNVNPHLINVTKVKYSPRMMERYLKKQKPLLERLLREER